MLPPDALVALDRLPAREALRRPLKPAQRPERRVSGLLSGESNLTEVATVGDALFQWARVEPESFADANIGNLRWTSELVGAAGRLPKRFSLTREAGLAGTSIAFDAVADARFDPGFGFTGMVRNYVRQQVLAHLLSAQGCEAALAGAESDPRNFVLNGMSATVYDPEGSPPTTLDRITFFTQKAANLASELQNNPFAFHLDMDPTTLNSMLPGAGDMDLAPGQFADICCYVNVAAQATRILWQRDTASIMQIASLASSGVAGHVGHIAGKAAAITALGLTGSWMIVLAPIAAGFTGRVVAKNLARRMRYHWLCRREVDVLNNAVRQHCLASRDVINANIRAADVVIRRFRELRANSAEPIRNCIEDWLERGKQIQDYRQLHADRFHRAASDPTILDTHGSDPILAAQESLLLGGRAGVHPANVAPTANNVIAALQALNRKMHLAVV
jgi:hypothetical protein